MRLPSPSMAVALAALTVATAGTATAARALLTGADVKNGSLTGADIRAGSLTLSNLSPAARAALRGRRGPAGRPGAPGGFDPSKVGYVIGPTLKANPNEAVTAIASCPAGTKVIGGGYFSIGRVAASAPLGDGSGWRVVAGNDTTVALDVTSVAICASK